MKGTDVIEGSTTRFCAACGRDLSIPETMIPGCSSCSASSKPPQAASDPPSSEWPQPPHVAQAIRFNVGADPTIGELVLYVLPDGPSAGRPRPAIIIDAPARANSNQVLLWVITAGSIDGPKWQNPTRVLASFSARKEHNTWHRRAP